MTGKEKIVKILNREEVDGVGFWLGNPTDETKDIYYKYFGITEDTHTASEMKNMENSVLHTTKGGLADLDLAQAVGSDMVWLSPELDPATWTHPEGKPMWDVTGGKKRESLNQAGVFADVEDVKELDDFDWPSVEHLDFSHTKALVLEANKRGMAVFGGMWNPFFHIACDLFGMENYFMKMYTHPEVVDVVTQRIVEFYLEANKLCLEDMADHLSCAFFGNDLGSQLNLLISPESFDRFILPYTKELVDQMKSYGKKVMLHSCGAIQSIIPQIIEIGVDALHPLQALAAGMDAESLAKYRDDIIFVGGVDTQQLLPFGTPDEVADKVRHLKNVLGKGLIISPSHEALLPNVSIENVMAMSNAAKE